MRVLVGVAVVCAVVVGAHGEEPAARELSGKWGWPFKPTKPTSPPTRPPTTLPPTTLPPAMEGVDKAGVVWYKPRVCGGKGFNPIGNGFPDSPAFDKMGFFRCICANFWNRTGAIFKGQKEVCDWCDKNRADGNYLLNGRNRRLSEVDEEGMHPTFVQNVNRFGRALDSPGTSGWPSHGWPWWLPLFGTNYLSLSCGCCRFWTAPPTSAPITAVPSAARTEAPTTATEAPTTEAPTTARTEAPTTEAPTTEAPTTEAPTTEAPTTETTEAPTTEAPTSSPTTPTTAAPTNSPTTPTVAVVNSKRPGKGKGKGL